MFAFLDRLEADGSRVVSEAELAAFTFEGRRISLLQPRRGIRVVAGLPAALSIRTTYAKRPEDRPYEDSEGEDGYYRYKWRREDPTAYDNVALRVAMTSQKPLAWFVGVAPSRFSAVHPVWLVDEEPSMHQFVLAFDPITRDDWSAISEQHEHPADVALRRRYATATVQTRLHQPIFRQRVLLAYQSRCALCRLRHPELLDAAHIREDSQGGQPVVTNGIAMCAIHHKAFDTNVLGIRPDYVVEVRRDVLDEADGPTLKHAIQALHGEELDVPRQRSAWPDTDLLGERYERFRLAG
jgi:putative restriction endonuclease